MAAVTNLPLATQASEHLPHTHARGDLGGQDDPPALCLCGTSGQGCVLGQAFLAMPSQRGGCTPSKRALGARRLHRKPATELGVPGGPL